MLSLYRHYIRYVTGCAFLIFSYHLLHASASDTKKEGSHRYSYEFNVTSVKRCPMNTTEHEEAEARLGCSGDQGYHCTPDKYHLNLIEFCYPKKRILVHTGNCLELASIGILNHVKCQNFSEGCPKKPCFSNEIYKYPVCLSIALECFTADTTCLQEKCSMCPAFTADTTCMQENCSVCPEEGIYKDYKHEGTDIFKVLFIISTSILGLTLVLGVLGWFLKRKRICVFGRRTKRRLTFSDEKEEALLLNTRIHDEIPSRETKEKYVGTKECKLPSLILHPKELECGHMLEDMELLLLLRRHCLHGASENFNYLLETRILMKNKVSSILESLDRNGCSLLHYAAQGGSRDIVQVLLERCKERKVNDVNNFGHTILHLACQKGRYDICVFLLSNDSYKELLLTKLSHQNWSAAHFTAVCGDIKIFDLLQSKKLEMNSITSNKLNILDIACINNQTDFCKELFRRNKEINLEIEKSDNRGWNIAHIAARVGNKNILELLINGNHTKVANCKTHQGKTIFHISCEYGRYDLCKFILTNDHLKELQHNADDHGWNALHFCAKGGNLKLLQVLEKSFGSDTLWSETKDGKTVLHICCIHKHVNICKYLCKKFKSDHQKINWKTKKLWTAAHYVAVEIQQNGTEEKN